ncbi:MAG: hypothetical protein ACXADY_23990 [Candidatus Hodarchaeales archaeon]
MAKALGYKRPRLSAEDILKTNVEYFKDEIKEFPTPTGRESEMTPFQNII